MPADAPYNDPDDDYVCYSSYWTMRWPSLSAALHHNGDHLADVRSRSNVEVGALFALAVVAGLALGWAVTVYVPRILCDVGSGASSAFIAMESPLAASAVSVVTTQPKTERGDAVDEKFRQQSVVGLGDGPLLCGAAVNGISAEVAV
eukprot:COSAG03_NODE_849_length_5637_cov_3.297941_6_plen_147_part_00